MFRAPPETSNTNTRNNTSSTTERPSFRDKVLGLFKQRQQPQQPQHRQPQSTSSLSSTSSSRGNKESTNPFSFRLNRSTMPVRVRSRRGLSRFMQRGPSTRRQHPKPTPEDVRASLRLIEDIFHLDEGQENVLGHDDMEEESISLSSEHTEPRDNRTNSKLNLGLSRSDLSRRWNRSPDSYKEMTHMSSPFRINRTSPRSPPRTIPRSPPRTSPRSPTMMRFTNSMGPLGGLSREESRLHLNVSCMYEETQVLPISSPLRGSPPRSMPSRGPPIHRTDSSSSPPPTSMHSRRSVIDRTDSSSSPPTRMQSRRSTINRTESPSSDKDSLKPPRTNCKSAVPSREDGTNQLPPPRGDRSPRDGSYPPIYPSGTVAMGVMSQGPMSRSLAPEPLKPRFREFPMKCSSQPMLSVPEREALPGVLNSTPDDAVAPTPYLPGFSEGDYVDDERLERILNFIQQQKTEMTNQETRSSSSGPALPSRTLPLPTNALSVGTTNPQGSTCRPTFDAKDFVDDVQLDVDLQNLQDRDTRKMKPCSYNEPRVSQRQYPNYYHGQVKVVSLNQKQDAVSPLRITFSKQESLPTIRREVQRTYSLPSISSIVRV